MNAIGGISLSRRLLLGCLLRGSPLSSTGYREYFYFPVYRNKYPCGEVCRGSDRRDFYGTGQRNVMRGLGERVSCGVGGGE